MKQKLTILFMIFIINFAPISQLHILEDNYVVKDNKTALNKAFKQNSTFIPNGTNGKSILFDEHHGGINAHFAAGHVSLLGGVLSRMGYYSTSNIDKNLTLDYIEAFDIIVISFPAEYYFPEEVTAIHSFIENGGSAIFVGTSRETRVKMESTRLNPLTELLGVTFQSVFEDVRNVITSYNSTHPVGQGVGGVYINDKTKMDINSSKNVDIIANVSSGSPIIASTQFGLGKAMFIATRDIFSNIFDFKSNGAVTLVKNIFDWLSGASTTIDTSTFPTGLLVPIRQNITVSEGILKRHKLYYGAIHIHSMEGSSDSSTPVADQIDAILNLTYDYFVLTDHNSDTPMDSRQPAIDYLKSIGATDKVNFIFGIEGDTYGRHYATFPIQKQFSNPDVVKTLKEYHDQGAVMFWAHPMQTYGEQVKFILENFDELGIDGFEIINSGFFQGISEFALNHNFIASTDAHSTWSFRRAETIAFVKDLNTDSFIEALLNRQVIAFGQGRSNTLRVEYYTGDFSWLNEYVQRNETMNIQVASYQSLLDSISALSNQNFKPSLQDLTTANSFLEKALILQKNHNIRGAEDAITEGIQNLFSFQLNGLPSDIKVGDKFSIAYGINDWNEDSIMQSSIELKLFDSKGELIQEFDMAPSEMSSGGYEVAISSTLEPGEFFLWMNVSVMNTFFESEYLLNVTKGISSIFESSSVEDTSSSSPANTDGFPYLVGIMSMVSVYVIHLSWRKRN